MSRHFGIVGAEVSGHFGTSADMSYGQFGTGAEVSWVRSVCTPYRISSNRSRASNTGRGSNVVVLIEAGP